MKAQNVSRRNSLRWLVFSQSNFQIRRTTVSLKTYPFYLFMIDLSMRTKTRRKRLIFFCLGLSTISGFKGIYFQLFQSLVRVNFTIKRLERCSRQIIQDMFVALKQCHLFVFVAHAYNDDCQRNSSCANFKSSIPYLIQIQLPSYLWENVFYLLSPKFPNMFKKPSNRSSTYCTIAQVNLFASITCLFGSQR